MEFFIHLECRFSTRAGSEQDKKKSKTATYRVFMRFLKKNCQSAMAVMSGNRSASREPEVFCSRKRRRTFRAERTFIFLIRSSGTNREEYKLIAVIVCVELQGCAKEGRVPSMWLVGMDMCSCDR